MKRLLRIFVMPIMALVLFLNSAMAQNEYDVKDFKGISIRVPADVEIFQAKDYKVQILAPESIIEKLEVEVCGDELVIKSKKRLNMSYNENDFIIRVWSPVFERIEIQGSSDIEAKTAIKSDKLKIDISGSGDVEIQNVSASYININTSGSGDVEIAGVTENVKIDISGSGEVDAEKLTSKNAQISIMGSGDVEVNASETIKGSSCGSGDIVIYGGALLDIRTSGSGSVRQVKY